MDTLVNKRKLKIIYKWSNVFYGGLIYGIGDTIATLIHGEFAWIRLLGFVFIGATLYAVEIPTYFNWIDQTVSSKKGFLPQIKRTILAMLYFNPIWIARHLFFIKLFSLQFEEINIGLFSIALFSFFGAILTGILGNFVIQNLITMDRRYIASSVFSAMMAIYYALSATWFA